MLFILLISIFIIAECSHVYDESISKISVNLSQAAYCVSTSWTCATCNNTNILEKVIQTHGERVLLGYNMDIDAIFVAFRGSSNIRNWIDDIQFHKIYPYNDQTIAVEKGFYKAYQNVKPDIFDTLDMITQKYSTKKLLLTGHSLGAALATLMAFDVIEMHDSLLYTYGSPRVGNDNFVQSFNSSFPIYRVTHYYDIVPHLPQEILGFLHTPQEIWYNEENNQYKICNDNFEREDDLCSDSCSPLHCTSTSDHLNYLGIPMGSTDGVC